MHHTGSELSRDLEHVWHHEEQALGAGEGGGHGSTSNAAVEGSCCSCLTLHLDASHAGPEYVLLPSGGPCLCHLRHRSGRGDGKHKGGLRHQVGDPRSSLIAIYLGLLSFEALKLWGWGSRRGVLPVGYCVLALLFWRLEFLGHEGAPGRVKLPAAAHAGLHAGAGAYDELPVGRGRLPIAERDGGGHHAHRAGLRRHSRHGCLLFAVRTCAIKRYIQGMRSRRRQAGDGNP
mmetsp:Transcript_33288/g.94316  ORF Transcript_33288/g.94316 Transcript_33288/m.94316 type:complete len:232 (-) Transcript_33288:632-1327(-)